MDTATIVILSAVFAVTMAMVIMTFILQYLSSSKVSNMGLKVILITGCDTGFGRAFVERFSGREVTVFAGCLSQTSIDEIKGTCAENIIPLLCDVTHRKQVESVLETVDMYLLNNPQKEFWGLVNNAGVAGPTAPADFLQADQYKPIMEVNYFGAVNVTHAFLQHVTRSRGRIVNTASMVAFTNLPYCGPYSASKAAMFAFSESLRREKQAFGVHVASVCPGAFATRVLSYFGDHIKHCLKRTSPEVISQYQVRDGNELSTKGSELFARIQARDLSPVLNAYEHALFSAYPRSCYSPGIDGAALRVISFIPTSITDLLLRVGFMPFIAFKVQRH